MGGNAGMSKRSWLAGVTGMVLWAAMLIAGPGSESRAASLIKVGLQDEPKTLNIMSASDTWSRKVLKLIYQPLYTLDPESAELIPWLAAEQPLFDEASLSYTVKLRPAKWSDGTPFTAEDVVYTGELIREYEVPRHISRWKFIKKVEALDERTVRFQLKEPNATFEDRTLTTPIVQKKEWEKFVQEARQTKRPETTLLVKTVEQPVGTGPFVLKEWKQGAYIYMKRNEHFFGREQTIQGRVLGPQIDGIVFKFYGTSDAAILGLKKGEIDMFWWGIQPGYLQDLQADKEIQIFSNERNAMYYMGFNLRKPPFKDVNLRRAVATLIDKEFIITRILQGHGIKLRSVIAAGNKFWHCPEVEVPGEGLDRETRIRAAYQTLTEAGYSWKVAPVDSGGNLVKGEGIRLPDGSPMKPFTILTPPADYDPLRAMSGTIIQEWLKELGLPASAKPMAFGALLREVKVNREFDAFILAYGALPLDPVWVGDYFHSRNDKERGWNQSGYRNPEFDRLADAAAATLDREKRRAMVWEMQKIIARDIPYLPLYNPTQLEAVRTDKFTGWVPMLEGIGSIWSFSSLRPK